MSIEQVRIPDIGDTSEVEVIELCVSEGDEIAVDDALIVIESDKASMEVPSTVAGKVTGLKVAIGDTCAEGDVIAEVEVAEAGGKCDDDEHDDEESAEAQPVDADTAETEASDEGARTDADEDAADGEPRIEEVRVPDVGEASEVSVVEVLVAAGDKVEQDDGLVALESDKATMEVPAPFAGKVVSIEVSEGDGVSEGTLIARIEVAGEAAAKPARQADERKSGQTEPGKAEETRAESSDRRAEEPAGSDAPRPRREIPAEPPESTSQVEQPSTERDGAKVYAGPAVRRLARELGVRLSRVEGSGNKGRIQKEDVHAHVRQRMEATDAGTAAPAAGGAIPPIPQVDFTKFGEIETKPLSRIMRAGAANLHRSWLNLPHVTQHDEADVTALEALRRELKPEAERAGVKLTPLPFIMKAVQAALVQFPRFNGSFAGDGENYVYKQYFHIGFAVDTSEGLMVPVVRDVDRKGIYALAEEIAELSERTRAFKLKPDEMRGGCMSVSSLGNIGGTGFTPIINAPEVAILGVSKLTRKPVWDGEGFVPRDMLPMSLSYDHRAINGAEAGRFMTWLCQALGDIRRLLL